MTKTITLTLLEYIVLPLIAIMASFSLKKKVKKNAMSIEEFLEDLNIDIKIICSLGLILFALSNVIHEPNKVIPEMKLNFCWMGVVIALLCYIYIHQFYQFRYEGFSSHKIIFFGTRHAVYRDSSWFVIILVVYVLIGLVIEEYHQTFDTSGNIQESFSASALTYYFCCLLCSYFCMRLFFYLLNQQVRLYLLDNKNYVKTFSNAFANEPNDINNSEAIKKYKLILATVKHNDPIRISVYERLSEMFEKSGDLGAAANYLQETIKLLGDNQVNKDQDYLIDACLTKLDFYRRNKMDVEAAALLTELETKFPNNPKIK